MNQLNQAQAAWRGRMYLLLVILLFAGPLAAAWLLVGHWRPAGSVHHGELLDPAQPLPALQLRRLDGEPLELETLHGHWTLAYLNDTGDCSQSCRDSLYTMRQTRLALGKDMTRVQTLLLLDREPEPTLRDWLAREHRTMIKGLADADMRALFSRPFPAGGGQGVYLIDPLGNLVMRYGPDTDPEGLLKDLERLLKYSKIG